MNLSHIDTCLPCYLQDHHGRAGELLLGVPVDGATTNDGVRGMLQDELQAVGDFDTDSLWNQAKQEIDNAFKVTRPLDAFDDGLEIDGEDSECDEMVYAYFVLSWDA